LNYIEQRRQQKLFGKKAEEKKVYTIPKVSEKKTKEIAGNKDADAALDQWFEDRRKEMTGVCQLCGGRSERNNDETFRNSIHHLFEKRDSMFPSVKLHPQNWIEVCFYGNSCHTNIHNGTITWELLHDSKEWEIIVEKFKRIYPYMADSEHKNIHPLLLKELK